MDNPHICKIDGFGKPDASKKNTRVCSVDGCNGAHYGHGYCVSHHRRFWKYGDPLAGGIRHGEAQRFIEELLVAVPTDDCVVWPFCKTAVGTARVNWRGVPSNTHSVVCQLAHGAKPTLKHECCHECGNGHLGCVNPRHLYWGTRAENVQDAIRHGTAYSFEPVKGEKSPAAKYSDEYIAKVRAALSSGERQTSVAKRFGISQSHVSRIKNGVRSDQR